MALHLASGAILLAPARLTNQLTTKRVDLDRGPPPMSYIQWAPRHFLCAAVRLNARHAPLTMDGAGAQSNEAPRWL